MFAVAATVGFAVAATVGFAATVAATISVSVAPAASLALVLPAPSPSAPLAAIRSATTIRSVATVTVARPAIFIASATAGDTVRSFRDDHRSAAYAIDLSCLESLDPEVPFLGAEKLASFRNRLLFVLTDEFMGLVLRVEHLTFLLNSLVLLCGSRTGSYLIFRPTHLWFAIASTLLTIQYRTRPEGN